MRTITFLGAVLLACGGDDGAEQAETPAGDACEHMEGGPAEAVVAGEEAGDAPSITFEHARVDVSLGGPEGARGGYVRYEADEAADFTFFLDADVPVALVGGAFEASEAVEACAAVAIGYTAALEVGPVVLKIGPTDRGTVSVVTVEAGHDRHE